MTRPDLGEDGEVREQDAAEILLLRVALRLLGEARLRGDFGDAEELAARAAAVADELTGGAPSPDPRRAVVEVELIRPDRISLTAPFREGGAVTQSLMLDGTLYDGATVGSLRAVRIDPDTLSAEERADLERRQAEWRVHMERLQQFTATSFVRAVTPPPQPGSAMPVLAVLLYEDGFYVEVTYHDEAKPEITVTDDIGTEYFESGGSGWGGGVRVSHSSLGFAPAPPPSARVLHLATEAETVEIDLRR